MRSKTLAAIAVVLLAALPALAVNPCAFSLLAPTSADTITKGVYIGAGDVNNDSYVDVIVSNQQENKYSVLLGTAGGGFAPFTSANITNPNALVVADFNGDDLDDFVMGWESSINSQLKVFVSNGDGTFTPHATGLSIPDVQNTREIVVADFNHDGKLDVATAGVPGVTIATGNGTGALIYRADYTFSTMSTGGSGMALAMADFNHDNNIDLVGADLNTGVIPLIGNGDGTFVKKPAMAVGGAPWVNAVMAGDFDGDGNADIIAGIFDGTIDFRPLKLFSGNGDGTFDAAVDRGSLQGVLKAKSIDIDNDGDLDAIITANSPNFTVMLNDGAGNFTSTPFTPGGLPYAHITADVDHDGGPDVLVTDFANGKVNTLLNKCGVAALNVTSSANPSNGGSNVTITATVVSPPAATATGTVTLTGDGPVEATGSVPSVSVSTSDLTIGNHTFNAEYSGDSRFYPGTASLIQTVQTAPFGPPPHVRATSTSTTSVAVAWFPTASTDHYEIQRGTTIGSLATIGTSPTTNYTDNTATAGNAYVYRARAVTGGGTMSAYSNLDLASTFTFTDNTLIAGITRIKAVHVTDLRAAIDAARIAADIGAASWTDASLSGVTVKAVHMNELRFFLEQARTTLGMTSLMYTDYPSAIANITPIRAVHIEELRAGLQ